MSKPLYAIDIETDDFRWRGPSGYDRSLLLNMHRISHAIPYGTTRNMPLPRKFDLGGLSADSIFFPLPARPFVQWVPRTTIPNKEKPIMSKTQFELEYAGAGDPEGKWYPLTKVTSANVSKDSYETLYDARHALLPCMKEYSRLVFRIMKSTETPGKSVFGVRYFNHFGNEWREAKSDGTFATIEEAIKVCVKNTKTYGFLNQPVEVPGTPTITRVPV